MEGPILRPDSHNQGDEDADADADAVRTALLEHAGALRARVQAAVARSTRLLKEGSASAADLRHEVEGWLLEAGRLEALVDEAIEGVSEEWTRTVRACARYPKPLKRLDMARP